MSKRAPAKLEDNGDAKRRRGAASGAASAAPAVPEGYLAGFGNHFATEALPGALPKGQNGPQVVCVAASGGPLLWAGSAGRERQCRASAAAVTDASIRRSQCPYALYAEQLSGTAFTAPRAANQRRCGRGGGLGGARDSENPRVPA